MASINLHQITHWQDPNLPAVLDLYQTAFPPNEQMRLSWWVRLLNELSEQNGPAQPERLLYAALSDTDTAQDVVGFAYCEGHGAQGAAYLMYLATRDDLRGQGIGARMYQQILAELFANHGVQRVVFEVEKPEIAAHESTEASEFARRRIAWYERQGACLLEGIHYTQSVGWQPPLTMHLMFHSAVSIAPEQAFSAATALFGDTVTQIGELRWRTRAR